MNYTDYREHIKNPSHRLSVVSNALYGKIDDLIDEYNVKLNEDRQEQEQETMVLKSNRILKIKKMNI